MSKYQVFTDWLTQCGTDTVEMSFEEMNRIVALPPSVYRYRAAWANSIGANATAFQLGWLNAGYIVSMIDLEAQRVAFTRGSTDAVAARPANRARRRAAPTSLTEELLLSVPDNLTGLSKDDYLMVELTRANSDIVEACIAVDPAYRSSQGKAIMERYFRAEDFSETAYYEIIRCIASENSTRTSAQTMTCMAAYCADPTHCFLERVGEGEVGLVDDLLRHLVQNGQRRDKSLASKLCRYLNEWRFSGCAYTINDSVVRAVLPYYLARYNVDRRMWADKDFEKLSYAAFYTLFCAVRDRVTDGLNNHQLDHLLWYAYKSDGIRTELAKALAKVL